MNLLRERKDRRIQSLPKNIQEELIKFEKLNSKDYQFQVIKKSRKKPQVGDIFIFSPRQKIYFYGRVLAANIKSQDEFFDSTNVIVLFNCESYDMTLRNYVADYDNLLARPMFIDKEYWNKGYFYTIANMPLSEDEKKLDIGFYQMYPEENFRNIRGEILNKEPKILGLYSFTTITGVAAEVNRELIMNGKYSTIFSNEDNQIVCHSVVYDTINSMITLDIQEKTFMNILGYIEEEFDIYMNGYNWEIFLLNYLKQNKPELLRHLEIDTEASSLILYYSDENNVLLKKLYSEINKLIESPQLIYDHISLNQDTIEWD